MSISEIRIDLYRYYSNKVHPISLNCLIFSSRRMVVTPKYSALHEIHRKESAARLKSFLYSPISFRVSRLPHFLHRRSLSMNRFPDQNFTFVNLYTTAVSVPVNSQLLSCNGVRQFQGHAGFRMDTQIVKGNTHCIFPFIGRF